MKLGILADLSVKAEASFGATLTVNYRRVVAASGRRSSASHDSGLYRPILRPPVAGEVSLHTRGAEIISSNLDNFVYTGSGSD